MDCPKVWRPPCIKSLNALERHARFHHHRIGRLMKISVSTNEKRALHWRHNDHDGVSNHQLHGCLLNRLFRRRSKKTSKLRVTGLCAGNSPGPVNSPHKGPVTRKMFPFDDVIMDRRYHGDIHSRMHTRISSTRRCIKKRNGVRSPATWPWWLNKSLYKHSYWNIDIHSEMISSLINIVWRLKSILLGV